MKHFTINKITACNKIYQQTLMFIFCSVLIISSNSNAQVVTTDIVHDGTMGFAGSPSVTGNTYNILQSSGQTRGTNLFHSFGQFSVAAGEIADFQGSSINNILARVTGRDISNIDGTLQSSINGANLYFFNPAGVVFGPDSSLNISGSFHLATADFLEFTDGSKFNADTTLTSNLVSFNPTDFGFLGNQSAQIKIDGSFLASQPGTDISFSAGSILLQSGIIFNQFGNINLKAEGDIFVQSGRILNESGNSSLKAEESIQLLNSEIDVSGVGAGSIFIESNELQITSTDIFADNLGLIDATGLEGITIISDVVKIVDGSFITTDTTNTFGASHLAANIVVEAGQLSILNGSSISSTTFASGDTGTISVFTEQLLIDGQGSNFNTGILNQVGSDGNGNNVVVNVEGTLTIVDGGVISNRTFGKGDAGPLFISTGQLLIDGQVSDFVTGIYNSAQIGSIGNANLLSVSVENQLSILNEGGISSDTFAKGDAASAIISADQLSILNGGSISSSTFAEGNAGTVIVSANHAFIDGQGNSFTLTGITSSNFGSNSSNAGSVNVDIEGQLSLLNGGEISSNTFSEDGGNAGFVFVDARQLFIDGQGNKLFPTGLGASVIRPGGGQAGLIGVKIENQLSILNGGAIATINGSDGNDGSGILAEDVGSILVDAGQLLIDGQGNSSFVTGITTQNSDSSTVNAGNLSINIEKKLSILDGGFISSNTFAEGNAGLVSVSAGELLIDSRGASFTLTGIASIATSVSSGNAGVVDVDVADQLLIINGGIITSETRSVGDAGRVFISAGQFLIDGQGSSFFTGASSIALNSSSGAAGRVDVDVDDQLSIFNGGSISSSTFAEGDAGMVSVTARQLLIDSQGNNSTATGISSVANISSNGNAGQVNVVIEGLLSILNGGNITSSTFAKGDAGNVIITAEELLIDSQGNSLIATGVSSIAASSSSGNAGQIEISIKDLLSILNGGSISSSTFAEGDAGMVSVNTRQLVIDGHGDSSFSTGIFTTASSDSQGQTGNIAINVNQLTLNNNSEISIESEPTLNETALANIGIRQITIDASTIELNSGSLINASSSGNVPASSITINASELLALNNASITTSANNADGGNITILIPRVGNTQLLLDNSEITTSVQGGDGGDIFIDPTFVILKNTSQIAANSFGGAGGNVTIFADAILPGEGSITASSNLGLNGDIALNTPDTDVISGMNELPDNYFDATTLMNVACNQRLGNTVSRFVIRGRGGVPSMPGDLLPSALTNNPTSQNSSIGNITVPNVNALNQSNAMNNGNCTF